MRPYSPGGALNAFASAETGSDRPLRSAHRLGLGLPGYLILFAPPAFRALSVRNHPESCLRLRRSPRYLRTLPLHLEFRSPLWSSGRAVSSAIPRLSRGISHLTYSAAYAPFKPNDTEQRWHHPYYRGCWHGFSRCFFTCLRQHSGVLARDDFITGERGLQPEGLHPSRGVTPSRFRALRNIPNCSLP